MPKRKRKLEKIEDKSTDSEQPKSKRRKLNHTTTTTSKKKTTNKNTKKSKEKSKKSNDKFIFILAHGAGTNSQHTNMQNWKKRLSKLGKVVMFDFKKPFTKMDKMVATYQSVIESTIKKHGDEYKMVLIGTSMGSRVSIHLANNNSLPNNCKLIIALGYPLFVKRKTGNTIRDEPLLNFINSKDKQLKQTRLCLISGSKDFMAPKDVMNGFYDKVKNSKVGSRKKCELHWIDGGNHSLKVGKRHKLGQNNVDQSVIDIVSSFIK